MQGDPVNSSTIEINATGNFGLNVNVNKTLTLKDVILNLTCSAVPSLKIDGILNLDHSEIKSTNDPVIQNNGHLNIIGNKISLIKKI